jgi:RNA polymerase sigma factor (sigma-70 family)
MFGCDDVAFDLHMETQPGGTRSPAQFVADIRPRLVRALNRLHRDPDIADDIAQESLTRVLTRWTDLTQITDLEGYVFRVAFNASHTMRRRSVRHERALALLATAPTRSDDDVSRVELDRALRALPPRQRETIVRRFLLDATVAETAAAMRCAPGTVKATTSHALDALRASLTASA